MKKILMLLIIFLLLSCTDKKGAEQTLLDFGYKPIEVGGYGWFRGAKDDFYITKFKAYSPNDTTRIVSGVVCSGFWFKASTIRTD